MATSTLGSGTLVLAGTTSGTTTVTATAVAGTTTLTLPAATDTLVGKATTDTLTNKTLTAPTLASANITTALTLTGASGTNGQALTSGGSGNAPTWTTIGATPGGSTTQVQYNNAGAFAGSANLVFDGSNLGVGVTPSAWGSGSKAIQINRNPAGSVTTIAIGDQSNEGFISRNAYHNGTAWTYLITDIATRYELNSSGGFRWYTAASGTAGTAITFTQSLAIEKAKSLALEGATSQTGTGITFPATQSASTDANTLDDYEEGTFTPTASGVTVNSGTPVYSGAYTKIGRIVFIRISQSGGDITLQGSGLSSFGGLPFTVASASTSNALWSDGSGKTGTVYAYEGSTLVYILQAISTFTNLTALRITATYQV